MADDYTSLLAESKAHLVNVERQPGVQDRARVLVRRFDGIPSKHIDGAMQYLADKTSVINDDSAVDIYTVVDPHAGKETYTGTWRRAALQSKPQTREQTYSIYQTLVYGDAEEYSLTYGVSCSSTGVRTYRWNMTREELDAYKVEFSTNEVAKRKDIRISKNELGLFDVVSDVTTADTSGSHLETSYTYPSNHNHDTTVIQRYNMLEADAQALIQTYQTKASGRQTRITMNRNEDCTYDVTITIIVKDAGGVDIDYTVGQNCNHLQSVSLRWDLTEAEAVAFVAAYNQQTEGVTRTASISRNAEDNTFNVNAATVTASDSTISALAIGTAEDASANYTFKYNLTEAEYQIFTAQYATRVHGRLRQLQTFRNPDCTYNVILIDRYKDQDSLIEFTTTWEKDVDSTNTIIQAWNLWDQAAVDQFKVDNALDVQTEGVSQTIRVSRNEDGTYDLTAQVEDGRDEQDTFTTIVGTNSTTVETAIYKFNLPRAEAEAFANGYSASEEGKSKTVRLSRQANGLYNVQGSTAEAGQVVTIDFTFGREVDIQQRIIAKWGLKNQTDVDNFVNTLNAQEAGITRNVQIFRNGDGSYNMVATIGDNNNPFNFTHTYAASNDILVTSIYAYNLENEAAVTAFLAANAGATPIGSTRQVRQSRAGDGTYNVTIITRASGQADTTLKTRTAYEGCDAEQISYTLYNRGQSEPAEPATPAGVWQLIAKSADKLGDESVNYSFTFKKVGINEYQIIVVEPSQEAEQRVVLLLSRDGSQPDPTFAGYSLVQTRVDERGECLADYRYYFTKDGTVQHEMESVFPGQDAEQKTITLLNRTSDPGSPSVAGFTVVRQSKRERGGVHTDYVYIMLKIPGSTYTIARRKIANGELMIQKVHMRQTDDDVTNYWADDGTAKVINVQYQPSDAGQGFVDIIQTLVHPFGYDGSTVIASKAWVDISRPYEVGTSHHNRGYRYWYTKYRNAITTTTRTQTASPAAVSAGSHSLTYTNWGTGEGAVANHPVGDLVSRELVSSPHGFWYIDVTTTTYSNDGLFSYNGGVPLKTPGKPYGASLT